jgi:hypothetical protein
MRQQPNAVRGALEAVTATYAKFVSLVLAAGADGIFFATTDWGSRNLMSAEDYREWGRPYDLRVLAEARGAAFNVLHVCKRRNLLFEFADYPVHAFSWDATDPTNPSLQDGLSRLPGAVMGGICRRMRSSKAHPTACSPSTNVGSSRPAGSAGCSRRDARSHRPPRRETSRPCAPRSKRRGPFHGAHQAPERRSVMRAVLVAVCLLVFTQVAAAQDPKGSTSAPPRTTGTSNAPTGQLRMSGNVYIGELAPDFELTNARGRPIKLSRLRGHSLLLAFAERREDLRQFREILPLVSDLDVTIVCVCADKPQTLKTYVERDLDSVRDAVGRDP